MLITFTLTIFVDLITAVALGLITAGVVRSRESEREELDSVISMPILDLVFFPHAEDVTGIDLLQVPVGLVKLRGRFSVASVNELARAVRADIDDHDIVIVDFSNTSTIDDSAALAIERLIDSAHDEHIVCIVSGLVGDVADILHALMVLRHVPSAHFVVESLDEAKRLSKHILDGRRAKGTGSDLEG